MDTRQVVARFEAERQALAMMDHPNIARVFDAGTTDSGLPYFVMELVKGVPITKYCDEHRLTPRQRMDLFVPVCHAVQHARRCPRGRGGRPERTRRWRPRLVVARMTDLALRLPFSRVKQATTHNTWDVREAPLERGHVLPCGGSISPSHR
jgi:hypothetical protein